MTRAAALIVNPASNRGRSAGLIPQLEARLRAKSVDVTTTLTESLEHATELAVQACLDRRVAVAVGGDGLVSAVAGGVAGARPDGVMAVVPNGRGNDLARWIDIRDLDQAVSTIVEGTPTAIDLGYCNGRPFVCQAAIGFDSVVLRAVESTRIVRGAAAYPYATVKSLLGWKPVGFRLTLDGVERAFEGFNVVVANAGSYGGGMRIAPDASLTDGLFDVVTIAHVSKPTFLRVAPSIFSGKHVRHRAVEVKRAREVRVTTDRPLEVCIDGELTEVGDLAVSLRPAAVKVLVPAK